MKTDPVTLVVGMTAIVMMLDAVRLMILVPEGSTRHASDQRAVEAYNLVTKAMQMARDEATA